MASGSRQDQWLNTVTIDGHSLGIWDTLAGGDVQATETKFKPGGMVPEITLGGTTSVNNITLTRLLDAERHWDIIRRLMAARVGKAETLIARRPLDSDGNPFGSSLNYSGILLHLMPGDTDSNSTTAHMWSIVVSTVGTVS